MFQIFFKKKRFLRNSSKPGHGNLVLITSTVQVELSKLNFNFKELFSSSFKAQITLVMLNEFCQLSKKTPPVPNRQY